MRWGFNWELGPFEVWDAIGVEKSVAKLKEEGKAVPANVQAMLDAGVKSFYAKKDGKQFYYDFASEEYRPLADLPGTIILKSLKDQTDVIKKNSGASLIDLGDGVACLEFHSKMNSIGGDTLEMLKVALNEVEKNFVGLVVGNQGQNFSVGANLMLMLMEGPGRELGRAGHDWPLLPIVGDELALLAQAGRSRSVSAGFRRRL
jgi:3-hydroxyacyl-CoA dehydrogenase